MVGVGCLLWKVVYSDFGYGVFYPKWMPLWLVTATSVFLVLIVLFGRVIPLGVGFAAL